MKKLYVQDNCSFHNSKLTTEWFKNHQEINLLRNWPPNSPDLNPIENFWAEMTRNWRSVYPRNIHTLQQYVVANWEKMRGDTQYFQNIYASMPHRIQEVIDRNGGATSY